MEREVIRVGNSIFKREYFSHAVIEEYKGDNCVKVVWEVEHKETNVELIPFGSEEEKEAILKDLAEQLSERENFGERETFLKGTETFKNGILQGCEYRVTSIVGDDRSETIIYPSFNFYNEEDVYRHLSNTYIEAAISLGYGTEFLGGFENIRMYNYLGNLLIVGRDAILILEKVDVSR